MAQVEQSERQAIINFILYRSLVLPKREREVLHALAQQIGNGYHHKWSVETADA
jgi:hypothetical protein